MLLNGKPHVWTADDFDFDNKGYQNEVAKNFISTLQYWYKMDFIRSMEFDYIDSPMYYNFYNDDLYAIVEFDDTWREKMHNFMVENYDFLKEHIKLNWSSRSGFISNMSNDIDEWFTKLFDEDDDDVDETYLEVMLHYMTVMSQMEEKSSDIDAEVLYDNARDRISDTLFEYTWEETSLYGYVFVPSEKKVEETV